MLDLIFSSLYFILPAYVANTCPVLFGLLKMPLGFPISEKLFGSHKTYRGFYSGYIGALITLYIQYLLSRSGAVQAYELLNYQEINLFFFALLFGGGAIGGDLIKSFFKRRLNIAPGRPFVPFDQLDLVLGALLFLWPVYVLPAKNIITLLLLTPLLHLSANLIAYKLKIKKVWW
ncbi:CDP-archaeol synthase [Candidatus Peregrinibacteria bacterium]|nr:CDP-archaeol synthase [Candidatus Peregrinibacteria bacterium]